MVINDIYTKRNSSIELFRFFSMMGIVVYHCFLWGCNKDYLWIYNLALDNNTSLHLALYSLGNAGVTCFMFISGYFGIKFNLRKLIEIVIMMMFYLIIIRCLAGVGWIRIIGLALHPWDGWWFVKSYFLICILSPLINSGIEKISESQFKWIVVLITIYTYFGHFLALKSEMNTDLLLTIFLWGRFLKLYPPPFCKNTLRVICATSSLFLVIAPIIIFRLTKSSALMTLFFSNNNFLFLLFAASTVILLSQHTFHSVIINWLTSSTLAIYVITDNELRSFIDSWLLGKVLANPLEGYFLIFLLCICCLLIEKVRILLFMPIMKVVNKNDFNL